MTFNRFALPTALAAAVLSLASMTAGAQNITGAGASFPAPVYAKWADAYSKATGVKVNYQSIGSGAGVKQIQAKTVDFGASDAPLTDEQLQKDGMIQFPTVIGGVVPVVNIKGVAPGQLKLTGPVLADIFLGKIKRWNEEPIKALNPGVSLPDQPIAVVRRADGSGTSFTFTSYLDKVSAAWKSEVGAGTAVKWPVGAGGKGNEGVAAFVSRLPGAIGYVEYAYAKQNHMAHVSLQNAAGHYVQPDDSTFKAAAAGIDWAKSFAQDMTNAKEANAWPISTATYIIVYKKAEKPEQNAQVLKFFDWAYTHGDQAASDLDYVPFPANVKGIFRASWQQVVGADGKPLSYK